MTDEGPARGAIGVASVKDYERRLKASMNLMDKRTRNNIIREIVAGVEEQVRVAGGDFARVAPTLDDPKWVGKQMVKVYGIGQSGKVALFALAAVFAVVSGPGDLGNEAVGTLVALLGFAALVAVTYLSVSLVSWRFALLLASTSAAIRVALFLIPLDAVAPINLASTGEVALFMVATAMVVLVAVLPALASRRGEE